MEWLWLLMLKHEISQGEHVVAAMFGHDEQFIAFIVGKGEGVLESADGLIGKNEVHA